MASDKRHRDPLRCHPARSTLWLVRKQGHDVPKDGYIVQNQRGAWVVHPLHEVRIRWDGRHSSTERHFLDPCMVHFKRDCVRLDKACFEFFRRSAPSRKGVCNKHKSTHKPYITETHLSRHLGDGREKLSHPTTWYWHATVCLRYNMYVASNIRLDRYECNRTDHVKKRK